MYCQFIWKDGDDNESIVSGSCDVKRSGDGYSVTAKEAYNEETAMAGTLAFPPVPTHPSLHNPGYDCDSDNVCLSLNSRDYRPETGCCLPRVNLKSAALPYDDDCTSELHLVVEGEEICVCDIVCGYVSSGGGGDPPICDPAYGCIDF